MAKRKRRRLERKWKMTGQDEDKHRYRDSCKIANDLINKSSSDQHYSKIESCNNDPRRKWSAIREILHPPTISSLTMPGEENVMSQRLADFFQEKVANIQSAISRRLGGSVPDPLKADTAYHVHKQIRKSYLSFVSDVIGASLDSGNAKPFWRYIKSKASKFLELRLFLANQALPTRRKTRLKY